VNKYVNILTFIANLSISNNHFSIEFSLVRVDVNRQTLADHQTVGKNA